MALLLLIILAAVALIWFETTEVSVPGAKQAEYVWDNDYDMFDDEYTWSYKRCDLALIEKDPG